MTWTRLSEFRFDLPQMFSSLNLSLTWSWTLNFRLDPSLTWTQNFISCFCGKSYPTLSGYLIWIWHSRFSSKVKTEPDPNQDFFYFSYFRYFCGSVKPNLLRALHIVISHLANMSMKQCPASITPMVNFEPIKQNLSVNRSHCPMTFHTRQIHQCFFWVIPHKNVPRR